MKKILLLMIAVITIITLTAGCNNQAVSEPEPSPSVSKSVPDAVEPETVPEPIIEAVPESKPKTIYRDTSGRRWFRIGMIHSHDSGYMQSVINGIRKYFSEMDTETIKYDFDVASGTSDVNQQMDQADEFIEKEYDVIIVELVDASMASVITEKAKAADIPVVYVHREPSEEDMNAWEKICFIDIYIRRAGSLQGEIVANLPDNGDIDGDGVVRYIMIMGDPENIDAQYRSTLSIKALTDRGIEVEELLKQNADWAQEKGQEIAASALEQFGDRIDVIFCNNDGMALGAYQAIAAAGRTVNKDIYLLGIDALDEVVDMINNGQMTGTVYDNADGLGAEAGEAAINYIEGKSNDKYTWIDYVPIVAKIE